jgi:hypothetical protein
MCIDEALQFISFTSEIIERLLHASDLQGKLCRLLARTFQELEDTLASASEGTVLVLSRIFWNGESMAEVNVSIDNLQIRAR